MAPVRRRRSHCNKRQQRSQTLLDIFMAWTRWSRMEVRLDKCCALAWLSLSASWSELNQLYSSILKKFRLLPWVNRSSILENIWFRNEKQIRKNIDRSQTYSLLEITSSLKIKPQLKLKILKHYIYSQISFELRLYDFSETWISQQLDNLCTNRIREWTEMPISGCVKEITSLPKELTGLGIPSLLSTHQKLWLGKRSTLKNSYHSPIRQIWNDSKGKHSKADSLLNENDNIKAAQKSLKIDQIQKLNLTFSLESQGLSARTVTQNIPKKRILFWSTYIESLPGFLYNFVEKRTSTTAYFSQPC